MGLTHFNEFVHARGRWLMPEMNWDLLLLNKPDALEALSILESDQVIVLGGDALFQHPDGRPTYGASAGKFDSFWRFTSRPHESFEDASARSMAEAREFLESYRDDVEGFIGIELNAVDSNGYRDMLKRKAEWDTRMEADSKKNRELHLFGKDQRPDEIADALNAARARSLKNQNKS